jgi:L-fuconolactonase
MIMSDDDAVVIDAHQHFWRTELQDQPWRRPEHRVLERDFEVDDLVVELDRAGIDGSVVMQSVDESAENTRLARYAAAPRVAGVVGWLPLQRPASAFSELERLSIPKLVGVRCLVADDPLDWLLRPDAVALFTEIADRGLAWDVVPITRQQTDAVIKLAHLLPELRMIIDHLGRPPVESGGWEPWSSQLDELAECSNVAIKISVGIDALTAWQRWDPDALAKYVDYAYSLFGPDRAMLASNWPVILLRADYQTAWTDLSRLVLGDHPAQADRAAITGGTARRWYRLRTPIVHDHGEVAAPTI